MHATPSPDSLEQEVRNLRRAVQELSILNQLACAIGADTDFDRIMRTIINRSAKAVHAEQATINLIDPHEGTMDATLLREVDTGVEHFHLNEGMLGCMMHERRPLMSNNPHSDPRLQGLKLAATLHSIICVPLLVGNQLIGVLSACNKHGDQDFDEDDQRLLAIIGVQSAQVLDRSRLLKAADETKVLQADVQAAGLIQKGLLPRETPDIPGYEVAGASIPALQVGGDYFDFIPVSKHCWSIALGDVSGKGLPASLLMANLQATLRSQAVRSRVCRECVRWCNKLLFLSTTPEKFATLFYSSLDIRSHVLTYCNAGHEYPFHFSATGEVRRLSTGGLAVGILDDFDYEDDIVHVRPGDSLVVFSDGVTDMQNDQEEAFSEHRLARILERSGHLPAAELVDVIVKETQAYAGDQPAFDDLTVVVLKRRPEG